MQITNLLEYLEQTVTEVPDKAAFCGEESTLTFRQVSCHSRRIGSFLANKGFYKKPVVVFMKKTPQALAAYFGVIYAGCFYVALDEEMPRHRIELIIQTVEAEAVICDETTAPMIRDYGYEGDVWLYQEAIAEEEDAACLAKIRDQQTDTDPVYAVFTSGSTGVPKGVLACHRSVIDYIENLSEVLGFDRDTVFGNQAPFYFDAALKEVIPTLKFGATTWIIPKSLFMFPIKLVEFLNEHRINTICWAASALTIVSSFKTFDKVKPEYVKRVVFVGEVFPIKQLNAWKEALPDALYVNLYGPTETTGVCCYYKVDREFALDETLPVGRPFHNTSILLLKEDNTPAETGEVGEICVRGTCLTLGYYNNPEKTRESFVQNPLNPMYPETIYRTGDLGKYNDRGELCYVSRKDYQIKHMGHRIELGEIEVVVNMHKGIRTNCCLFDDIKKKIVLYYVGDATRAEVAEFTKEKLPRYMFPNVITQLESMPYTANGKIDRVSLKNMYNEGK
ncbi:MAG: amino acid adenylation domain-containing protein [Parasporobacterium sp.]|nr:amino acid adenylation domain-containing protein [Parasporobacterium sp.]